MLDQERSYRMRSNRIELYQIIYNQIISDQITSNPIRSNYSIVSQKRKDFSYTYDTHVVLIHTREFRQLWYCSSNISYGIPFLLYAAYACERYHSTVAFCHHHQDYNSEEREWIHHDSNSYQGGKVGFLRMLQNACRCQVTRFATLLHCNVG